MHGVKKTSSPWCVRDDTGVVGDRRAAARWKGISLESLHELNRDEVERLLEKVEQKGVGSLTQPERQFLDRMSAG